MGKITIEVKINTFGNMLYSLNHPKKVPSNDGSSPKKMSLGLGMSL